MDKLTVIVIAVLIILLVGIQITLTNILKILREIFIKIGRVPPKDF